MKNHLKRITVPPNWIIDKHAGVFMVKPNPGSHAYAAGLPLGHILRDLLHHASTMHEVKMILREKQILVDGKRQQDPHVMVGLFDVLSIPELQQTYRMILDFKGRLQLISIGVQESNLKPCRLVGKTALRGNRLQLHLHDGKNILLSGVKEMSIKVGDTALLSLPELKIQKILPLQPGACVFLTRGKHAGSAGVVKEIKGNDAIYVCDGKEIPTRVNYLLVVGEKQPLFAVEGKMVKA